MLQDKLTQQEKNHSPFEDAVRKLATPACGVFRKGKSVAPVGFQETGDPLTTADSARIAPAFPKTSGQNRILAAKAHHDKAPKGKRVAVLFSGGPAAGGHNVVVGLKQVLGSDNTLLGVKAGPAGLIKGDLFEVTEADVARIFNTGGFDYLGSDRTKIKSDEQFAAVRKTCRDHSLDGIVVIGGDDSNTNAALLAEYMGQTDRHQGDRRSQDHRRRPQNEHMLPNLVRLRHRHASIYAEITGNILQDTPSREVLAFHQPDGPAAVHIDPRGARCRPGRTVAIISEEMEAEQNNPLTAVVDQIARPS